MTLAETLREAGWTTAGIVSGGYCQSAFGFGHGFQSYQDTGVKLEELNDRYVLPWLQEHRRKKFFLYIHAGDVHDPYDTTPHYNRLWDPDYRGTVDGSRATLDEINEGGRPLSARDLRHLLALYDGGISYTDAQIARIIDALKSLGLYDRTLVIVTADHGESFREHGKIMQHGRSPYETELRIPLIMRIPGLRGGIRVEAVTQAVDLFPTVIDALGLPVPSGLQGRSALDLLKRAPAARAAQEAAFSQTSETDRFRTAAVAREGRWKLIRHANAQEELYDLESDPGEAIDRAGARPDIAGRLRRALAAQTLRDEAAAATLPPLLPDAPLAPDMRAKLRASGYIR
jgi:arylsulfatase A-like enzyme